jgi:thiosulfate/3-mercaptopyruvate sulfurtransferase
MTSTLITASELLERIDDPDLVVVDCRWYLTEPEKGRSQYLDGHIPGAVYASLDTDLAGTGGPGRHPLPQPEDFAATCERLGVTRSSSVVAYDDAGGGIAARLWWMLENQGHRQTHVLDGGIQAWTATGGALDSAVPDPRVGDFAPRPWSRIVERDDVVNRPQRRIVIDARARERYRGDEEPVDPKAGHIPGALSMPLTENLGPDLTFLPPTELAARFASVGVSDAGDVIAHCGSGVTACHNILAMSVAGIGMADLYVGSWSDWSTSGLPVATGDDPG